MRKLIVIFCISLALTGALTAGQPAGGEFLLERSTLDGGGGVAAGGDFILTGTIGQADASATHASGGSFAHDGGFWARLASLTDFIFKGGFESEQGGD